MTPDEALALAWTKCCPTRNKIAELPFGGFPTGFWPDVARVAMHYFVTQDADAEPPFRYTTAGRGSNDGHPRTPGEFSRPRSRGKLSAEEKRANTAALLAKLAGGNG